MHTAYCTLHANNISSGEVKGSAQFRACLQMAVVHAHAEMNYGKIINREANGTLLAKISHDQ